MTDYVPTNLTATASGNSVSLTWDAPTGSYDDVTYTVYRSDDGGSTYNNIKSGLTTENYTDSGLNYGTEYYYKVYSKCVDINGTVTVTVGSGYSNIVSVTTGYAVPSAPQNLSLSSSGSSVSLSWDAPSDDGGGLSGYKIYRGTSSGGESYLASTTDLNYTDTVSKGNTYYYYVTAYNDAGESSESNEVSYNYPYTVPSAPSNLSASVNNGIVNLSWNAPSDNGGESITEYKIYRGTSSGGESNIDTSTDTSYSDSSVSDGNTYYYYVTAVNGVGESGKSNEVNIYVPKTVSESVSDSAVLSDSYIYSTGEVTVPDLIETINASSVSSLNLMSIFSISDSSSLTSNSLVNIVKAIINSLSETITSSDSTLLNIIYSFKTSDSSSLTSNISTKIIEAIINSLSETINVSESTLFNLIQSIKISDSSSLTDNVLIGQKTPIVSSVSDSINVSDNVSFGEETLISVSDSANLTESLNYLNIISIDSENSETITVKSEINIEYTKTPLTEKISFSDNVIRPIYAIENISLKDKIKFWRVADYNIPVSEIIKEYLYNNDIYVIVSGDKKTFSSTFLNNNSITIQYDCPPNEDNSTLEGISIGSKEYTLSNSIIMEGGYSYSIRIEFEILNIYEYVGVY